MKLVINQCYGGFSLSRQATARMAELQGRECYFFTHDYSAPGRLALDRYIPAPPEKPGRRDLFWFAFDIPNPDEVLRSTKSWHEMTTEERTAQNALHEKHGVSNRPDDRSDPLLIRVVEELGEAANGGCAKLAIVEIPDGIVWEIDEYDGIESIHEKHRSWP